MTANPHIRQPIPVVSEPLPDDDAPIGRKSARQLLFDLFDAADQLTANVSLWERDDPDAPTALYLWASDHCRTVQRYGHEEYPSIEMRTAKGRTVCVYLRPPAGGV